MFRRALFFCAVSIFGLMLAVLPLRSFTGRAQSATLPGFCSSYPPVPAPGQWQSSRVFYSSGRLTYVSDDEGNRIPDFSYAGYRYGEAPIPAVPEATRITPTSGDNTQRIQQALDQVGARPPDASGIRGAVVLAPGTYEIRGTVRVNRSGVVLRGSGDGGNPSSDTILRATGDTPHQRPVVVLGSGNSNWTESATRTNITTSFVQVGSKSFDVESTSGFAVGDNILVHHPSTQAWIDALGGGGVVNSARWRPGQIDITYNRRITEISGNTIIIDAPVYNHLDLSLSQSYIAKVTSNHVTESGVESLRVDIVTAGGEDENHAWNGVQVNGAQDSWVRRVTALHFGYAGVRLDGVVRVTVEDCRALDPVGIRTGGRFYNFAANNRSQLALFKGCHATRGRHAYVSNGESSVSGLVFYRCTVNGGGDMEAGHRHWTQGVLFDNIVEQGSGSLKLINRGDWGTSHGWGSAHSVAWSFNKGMYVQKPPTAQNYGISATGSFPTNFRWPGPVGFTERQSGTLVPASLYEAQLCERLNSSPPPSCVTATSGGAWQNTAFASQEGAFTAEFDATPSASPINSVVALSQGERNTYTGFACLARFNPSGNIDARNGGGFAAESTIPYYAGVKYHFRLVVNVPEHTYSIYVTPEGEAEQTVGLNYAFRTEQSTVTSLDSWGVYVNASNPGSLVACDFTVALGVE